MRPTACRSAAAASNEPRCPPASNPCVITASAPARSASRASASVVAVANQATPAALSRATYAGSKRPMIEETAVGRSSRNASHCSR